MKCTPALYALTTAAGAATAIWPGRQAQMCMRRCSSSYGSVFFLFVFLFLKRARAFSRGAFKSVIRSSFHLADHATLLQGNKHLGKL
jgi:hypothetical protein